MPRALKQFPNIGDPGAEKILMFCGASIGLPLEWNGLRVLAGVGYGQRHKNYAAAYRSVQEAVKPELPRNAEAVAQAHLLLRQHGKELCRDKSPQCYQFPVKELCAYSPGLLFSCSIIHCWTDCYAPRKTALLRHNTARHLVVIGARLFVA